MGGPAAPVGMTTLRERMLIRRLQQRDERAFSEVVRLYQHKIYNLVYRMVGSRLKTVTKTSCATSSASSRLPTMR